MKRATIVRSFLFASLITIILFVVEYSPMRGDETMPNAPTQTTDVPDVFLPVVLKALNPVVMVVPAGEFQMGCDPAHTGGYSCLPDELPLHAVYLDAYNIDKYETTNNQYAAFLNGRNSNDCGGHECIDLGDPRTHITYQGNQYLAESGYGDHPVIEVSWYGANSYCTENGGRLPTEAEWEIAARGTTIRAYPWGDQDPDCTLANFSGCLNDTSQVGAYPAGASPYGAMDMAGNVWEWVNDWYDANYYISSPYSNPQGPASGTFKVLRGGGWSPSWSPLRVAYRNPYRPQDPLSFAGFRCASS
ncbi:MAG: hypothetical protein DWQ04_22055 [Chloroflexi bacterium]|nr:MAG: hypothetical protein DWQ04_22055 [Chloroflexota bacterium]